MQIAVYRTHHREASDVELSTLVEKWFFDVFLNDVGATVAINICVLYQGLDVVYVTTNLNTAASISVLSRLDDPEGLAKLRECVKQCAFVRVLCIMVQLFKF